MYEDVEADFWKEQLVQLIKNNMRQKDSQRITMENCFDEFKKIKNQFPDEKIEEEILPSYVTWETEISNTIKLRLFIQNQIKVSILQKNENEYIKIADGKFPYNPFPDLAEFMKNKDQLLEKLYSLKQENLKYKKQQTITGEIIKALIKKKVGDKKIPWNLVLEQQDFTLYVQKKDGEVKFPISMKNFAKEINEIDFD